MDNLFTVPLVKELASFREDINAGRKIPSMVAERINQYDKNIKNMLQDLKRTVITPEEDAPNEENLNVVLNKIKVINGTFTSEQQKSLDLERNVYMYEAIIDRSNQEIKNNNEETLKCQRDMDSLKIANENTRAAIVDNHKACLLFNHLYKTYSGCELQLRSSDIVRIDFSSEIYAELRSDDWKFHWQLLDCKPNINNMNEIRRKLYETGNILTFLASFVSAARGHKHNKY